MTTSSLHPDTDQIATLRSLLVAGDGSAEPRAVAAALAGVPTHRRDEPICRFADAVIARTGNLAAADIAHRRAASALEGDAAALCAVLCSWLGIALNRQDLSLLLELRERGDALRSVGRGDVADAIVGAVDAAGLLARGQYAAAEAALVATLGGAVPAPLRGAIAFLRSVGLQALGLLDASVQVLDADAGHLGVFDLAAEIVRARRQWVDGEHQRARSMLAHVHAEARRRGRQHDGDFAAALSRVFARIDGDQPDLPSPTAATPPVATMLVVERALMLAGEPEAADAHLRAHPSASRAAPELLAVPYVLCPSLRQAIDAAHPHAEPSDSLECARALVAHRAGDTASAVEAWQARNLYRPWAAELVAAAGCPQDGTAVKASSAVDRGGDRAERMRAAAAEVRVLGPVSLVVDGTVVSVRRERVRALLALLALHRRMTRERLIDVLWPDLAPGAGANNLRTTLTYARQLSPHAVIATEGRTVAMVADVDLWHLDEQAVAARAADAAGGDGSAGWRAAAGAVTGRFADDVHDAAWLDAARFSVDATSVDALLRAAATAVDDDPALARRFAERALEVDPWSDRALVLVARSWRSEGDLAAAHRSARRAEQLLRDLGATPDHELQQLLAAIG